MSRANPTPLFVFFMATIAVLCGAALLKGGLYLAKHEGDTFHAFEIVLRLADGQWPHLDFMTPIGILAFAPIAFFVGQGFDGGTAFLLAQTSVTVALLPVVWWTSYSRLHGLSAYLFGFFVIVLSAALIHGEAQYSLSISMHYNRWSWALAFTAIVLALFENRGKERPVIDGIIIGLFLAALALIKITYFVGLAFPILLALLLRRQWAMTLWALLAGLAVAGLLTALAGFDFWLAYLHDLLLVSTSELRSAPGDSLGAVISAPAYMAGSMSLVFAVLALRRSGAMLHGLILFLLAPGFYLITYQNYGNDPQWLLLSGIILLANIPSHDLHGLARSKFRNEVLIAAVITFALIAPSFLNLTFSPLRHRSISAEDYTALAPKSEHLKDLYGPKLRVHTLNAGFPIDEDDRFGLLGNRDQYERPEPDILNGEALPSCEISSGIPVYVDAITTQLADAGYGEDLSIYVTDLFSHLWLFAPLNPIKNGAPWNYGGLPGIENADYVLVPKCSVLGSVRKQDLETINERGIVLEEVHQSPLFILTKAKFPAESG